MAETGFHDGLDPADNGGKKAKASHVWERDPHDWYVEPTRCTRQLLSREQFIGPVWDPACGQGNIIRTLQSAGKTAIGTDIVRRVGPDDDWFYREQDFLSADQLLALNIICNPPFYRASGTEAFIRKALELGPFKVAMFCDVRFLAGAKRAEGLFADHPPSRVWIVTPRASCPPGTYLQSGGKAAGGSSDWCWLVWDRTAPFTGTSLGWLIAADGEPNHA